MLTKLMLDRPLAFLDLETTGTDVKTDRIVEIGILKLNPGAAPDSGNGLVNPGRPIPKQASAVHGIKDADVADQPTFAQIALGLLRFPDGCDLCGYNLVRFDLRLLLKEFTRVGIAFPLQGRRIIDPCRIFHRREPRDLSSALRFYCAREHDGSHRAKAEVLATADVLEAQLDRYADLPRTVGQLHEHLKDPSSVDLDGMFTRNSAGCVAFARGKYKGQTLNEIAFAKPDYLQWMLREDFFEDTKAFVIEALREANFGGISPESWST